MDFNGTLPLTVRNSNLLAYQIDRFLDRNDRTKFTNIIDAAADLSYFWERLTFNSGGVAPKWKEDGIKLLASITSKNLEGITAEEILSSSLGMFKQTKYEANNLQNV